MKLMINFLKGFGIGAVWLLGACISHVFLKELGLTMYAGCTLLGLLFASNEESQ